MIFKIYGLYDPREEIIRYVGCTRKTLHYRLLKHLGHYREGLSSRSGWYLWLDSMIRDGVEPKIQLLQECATLEEGYFAESEWVILFKSQLVNETNGGSGAKGLSNRARLQKSKIMRDIALRIPEGERKSMMDAVRVNSTTPTARAKAIATQRRNGKIPTSLPASAFTPEARRKIAETRRSNGSYKHTDETKEKIRLSKIGVKASEETKKKKSEALKLKRAIDKAAGKIWRHHSSEKTHCPQGHPYSGENLGIKKKDGSRYCKECNRIRYWKKKELLPKKSFNKSEHMLMMQIKSRSPESRAKAMATKKSNGYSAWPKTAIENAHTPGSIAKRIISRKSNLSNYGAGS